MLSIGNISLVSKIQIDRKEKDGKKYISCKSNRRKARVTRLISYKIGLK